MVTSRRKTDASCCPVACHSFWRLVLQHLQHTHTHTHTHTPPSFPHSLPPLFPPPPFDSPHPVPPGSIKGVRELGMSQFRHTDIKGNLYIKFEIVFPDSGFLPEEEDRKVWEPLSTSSSLPSPSLPLPLPLHSSLDPSLFLHHIVLTLSSNLLPLSPSSSLPLPLSPSSSLQVLASLLPPPPPVEPAVDAEEVDMIEFEGTKGDEGDHRREAYNDSDDEDGPRVHSHGMGCTQQ